MQPGEHDLQGNEDDQQQQQQRREKSSAMNGASGSAGQGQGGGAQDDDEPVLKYQRMGADVGKLLLARQGEGEDAREKETVVRMAVHDSHLVR